MLTPTQLLERMLETVVKFDGAHTLDSVDRSLLRAEANILFRILRVIDESSGQRFALTANGKYLDLIGGGMNRPRYDGETDSDYRSRLVFNEKMWNDVTISGIKEMIRSYYGIDMDNDQYDETRLVELYKQAACFFNREKRPNDPNDWGDNEGWVDPSSDFGATWLGADTLPGAFEVHLRCFQEGDEKIIKKRHLYDKLMAVRAAGIVVMLYFHLDLTTDTMQCPQSSVEEMEIELNNSLPTPEVEETFDVLIQNSEVTSIIANTKDVLKGTISRRIVHDEQRNKCRADYSELLTSSDPVARAEAERGALTRRAEPWRFRQSRLRNSCWSFYYGVKYEEQDITGSKGTVVLFWSKPPAFPVKHYRVEYTDNAAGNVYNGSGLVWNEKEAVSPFIVEVSQLVDPKQPSIELREATDGTPYEFKVTAIADDGRELSVIDDTYTTINENVHTYYTRPNPMVDATHHYRGYDMPGLDFFSIVGYTDFWWRVATIENGLVGVPCVPWKMTIYRTQEEATRFWWRVTTFDGQVFSAPSKAQVLDLVGRSFNPAVVAVVPEVSHWHIQTVDASLPRLSTTNNNLIILDRLNESLVPWHRFDIVGLRLSYAPDRTLIARLPVSFLPLTDPRLPTIPQEILGDVVGGRRRVKYWMPEWHVTLRYMIDEILRSGFQGVFLDGLNEYESWTETWPAAESDMLALVQQVWNYGRAIRAQNAFFVLSRGGEQWQNNPDFLSSVSGGVIENVFYDGDHVQGSLVTVNKVNALNTLRVNGKMALALDYPTSEESRASFYEKCQALRIVPLVTTRGWDKASN